MSTRNENGRSFKFSISDGDVYGTAPMLLGRDNPYTLNVKLVDKDGKPVSGVQYSISSTNDGQHRVNLDGMGKTYTSSVDGNSFYLEGLVATEDAHINLMQYEFTVDCVAGEGTEEVTGKQVLRMGRLLQWGRPGISVKTSPDTALFTTKTERVGKESTPGAKWNWGEKIDTCNIKVADSITGSGMTSLTGNNDASFHASPEIDLSKLSNVSKAKIQFEGGLSSDGFTAVLASSQDNVELYYFQSVAFTKPSVVVGVPAEVTCKLTGLDKKPRANVDVEWSTTFGTLDPASSKTDAQGLAKTQCTANDSGTATVTVLSKTQRMIKGTSPAIPVGPLVIADSTGGETRYIVGHSAAIPFSVTLKAGGQPVPDLTVEWFIGGTAKGSSTSNSSGKATCDLNFTADQDAKQVVKARVLGTEVQTTFDVDVYIVQIADHGVSANEYIIKHTDDVVFSIWLKAGGVVLPNVEVEWLLDGALKNTVASDKDGKVTHHSDFGVKGNRTMKARVKLSGQSVDFPVNVYEVELTEPNASETEYLVKHSPDVEFSAVLKAGSRKLSGIEMEWDVGGTTVTSKSDGNGKATFRKGFDTPGNYTVTLKDPKSGRKHDFSLPAYAVEITNPIPPAPVDYVLGISDDINFSLVLKAGGKLRPNIAVDWSVGGQTETSTSDSTGKVLFKKGFDAEGTHTVTAKVSKSGQTASFTVNASTPVFDVKWSARNAVALIADKPDLRFRLHKYTINVRIVDKKGTPLVGIRFKLTAAGSPEQNAIRITELGAEKSSTAEGINYTLMTEWSKSPVDFSLTLASAPLKPWSHTYKMGWLYEPARAHYAALIGELNVRYHSVEPTMSEAPPLPFDLIELRIPARNWVGELGLAPLLNAMVADRVLPGIAISAGDKISSPFHTSKNGYVVLLAGEVAVGTQ